MKKRLKTMACIFLIFILGCGTLVALAAEPLASVKPGETYSGDLVAVGDSAINEGNVQGDLLALVQTLSSRGYVDGDILGGGYDVQIDGNVNGNVRVGAYDIKLSATIERNAMIFGTTIDIGPDALIKRNVYLYGSKISTSGKVMGKTDIYGYDVTLGGTYEGDVVIHDMDENSTLNLLPGTVIKGKLTYKGVLAYQVPADVSVGSYEYIKINPVSKTQAEPKFDLWSILRALITMVLYYLVALLLYKLFPRFFARSGDFIAAKPLTSAGIGIATLGSLVGGGLLLILLLVLTLVIFKGTVFFFTGLIFVFFTALTFVFADIPVSLWLGNALARKNLAVPTRLAIGLISITAIKMALDLLGNIPAFSTFAGIIAFLINAFIWVMGTGALLRIIFEIFKSANTQAEAEAIEIEPINF